MFLKGGGSVKNFGTKTERMSRTHTPHKEKILKQTGKDQKIQNFIMWWGGGSCEKSLKLPKSQES